MICHESVKLRKRIQIHALFSDEIRDYLFLILEENKNFLMFVSRFQIFIKPINSHRNFALCLCHCHPPLMDGLHNIKTTKKINTLAFGFLYSSSLAYLM